MNADTFSKEIRNWLETSGKLKDLQTKLRYELIEAISQKDPAKPSDPLPKSSKILNNLFLEHLIRTKCWYTASIFAKEGSFIGDPPHIDPDLGQVSDNRKMSDEEIDLVLATLNLKKLERSESLRVRYFRKQDESLIHSLLLTLVSDLEQSTDVFNERLQDIEMALRKRKEAKMLKKVYKMKAMLAKEETTKDTINEYSEATLDDDNHDSMTLTRDATATEQSRPDSIELQALRAEVNNLKETIEKQSKEIRSLRRAPVMPSSTVPDTSSNANEVNHFLSNVKSKLNVLYKNSEDLDNELSEII